MIGTLRSVVVDCRQPRELAGFWRDVLGGTLSSDDDDDETWVVLTGRRPFPIPAGLNSSISTFT